MNHKNLDEIIDNYRNGRIKRRELISTLSELIIKIPHYFNCYDEDFKNDYYVMILSKIDNLLKTYKKIEKCRFTTWFIHILKRQYIQFYCKNQYQNKYNEQYNIEYNDEQLENSSLLSSGNINNYFENGSFLNLSELNEIELKIIELKYGFDADTFYTEHVEKKVQQKSQLESRLSKSYNKLLDVQKEIRKSLNIEEIENLKRQEALIITRKRNNERRYKKITPTPSNKWVSEQVNLCETTVGTYLTRIKKKLKSINENITENVDDM
ncbi:MAG: hypothetical protein A2015_01720 [Spirochaetes bacterium GWF1_31_7]|nr:MAG: hypothetical protein A2Y30_03085 [Spirochaetes bacterium GWE1_32_154]OHD48318.1 MAG: hypothetical protein A2Y29_05600 [Spirochaetes bacterium GWE2_31_10]OHD49306.1 MAG: hypothetical protein A2015_01720 [Spirochaetes bacterium GWF1_31_7]HBD92954.1 hypothetical protein [Spirochaetia bacterium]HBI37617.1 hypothetical protein [Spirochaetia bacterium]